MRAYADNWGEILLRSEAWVVFKNAKKYLLRNNDYANRELLYKTMYDNDEIARRILDPINSFATDAWKRDFENLSLEYRKYMSVQETQLNHLINQVV